jgi:hypothetical protein
MEQYPEISYTHILSELSVNRKDPCEVIRELISNSYDAEASRIEIYPCLEDSGFIFFDNGTGLSETKEINGITPYKAFFSIGKSTKTIGNSIGYKCQGSKLCFAAKRFTLITRCQGEEYWRSICIDNPKDKLNPNYNISSNKDDNPWDILKNLFLRPDERTVPILNNLNEEYFKKNFTQGAMIIVQGLEVDNFSYYYGVDDDGSNGSENLTYLRNYIRFNTRHGDMRILRPEETDFQPSKAVNFSKTSGYNDRCEVFIWTKESLSKVPVGYPYLSKPDGSIKSQMKSPSEVSRLRDGQFYARYATTFQFNNRTYCLALAIDGNRRALNNYPELDRRGQKRSGIRLTDQRGTFICSQGVKICSYNEIFESSKLQDYLVLGKDEGQSHYIFMINGNFELVTNRNSLTEAALKVLKDELFIDKIKQFFDQARKDENSVFRQLVERLIRESESFRIDAYIQQLDELKKEMQYRTRFMVDNIEQLKGKWLVSPSVGEEHWVGALYTMFSHLVPANSEYVHLWLRPRTFCGTGIDSIAVGIGDNRLEADVHKSVEYKYIFSQNEGFNHPLIVNDHIICWEMQILNEGDKITDTYGYFGDVSLPPELNGIGYEIINIQSQNGDFHDGKIKLISLKNLLEKTFSCQWTTPPTEKTSNVKKNKKARK